MLTSDQAISKTQFANSAQANDKWYSFSGISKSNRDELPWMRSVWHEDAEIVITEWNKMVQNGIPIHFEFRFQKTHRLPLEDEAKTPESSPFTWVLASAYPDVLEDGTFLSISGTLTDISQQKFAEVKSEKKASKALESKRQTDKFLDMVR